MSLMFTFLLIGPIMNAAIVYIAAHRLMKYPTFFLSKSRPSSLSVRNSAIKLERKTENINAKMTVIKQNNALGIARIYPYVTVLRAI